MYASRSTHTPTHAGRMLRSALCLLAVFCAIVRAADAGPPQGALAWIVVEAQPPGPDAPRPAPPSAGFVETLVSAMLPARSPTADAVAAVIGHALSNRNRIEVVLLDFAADPGPKDGTAIMVRFALIVRVEGATSTAIRAVVSQSFPGSPLDASFFAVNGAPAWQTITIAEQPGAILLAVGRDALAAWDHAAAADTEPAWSMHEAALDSHQAGATAVAAAFIDANALRRAFPESFASGRLGRLAHAWGIPNARSLMLRAATLPRGDAPPALLLAAAFEARSRPPGAVVVEPIIGASWPGHAGELAPDDALWASAVPAAWSRAHEWAVRTWEASRDGWGTIEFDARRARWERQHMPRLQRLFGSTAPWAILAGNRAVIPLAPDAEPARVAADLATLLATFGDRATTDALEGSIRVGPAPGSTIRWSVRNDTNPAITFQLTN